MITGMSWGALSYNAKVALAQGARAGRHLHHHRRRRHAARPSASTPASLIYEVLPSRYGINIHHLRSGRRHRADHRPGRQARHRRPAARLEGLRRDRRGPRAAAGRRSAQPGAAPRLPRPRRHDHQDRGAARGDRLAGADLRQDGRHAASTTTSSWRPRPGADVVVVDGMEGGTGASPDILQEHTGIPTLAAVCEARQALEDMGLYGEVQLIIAGGIRSRRGRGQGPGARRRRRLHRHGGADRAQLQQAALRRGLRRRSAPSPTPATTATPAAARSASPPRIPS